MTTDSTGQGRQPSPGPRTILIEGNGETLGPMLKRARIRDSWFFCDEGSQLGGDSSAPTPMEYFVASIIF